ncbi:putative bifunctional diguanylate cyclase/phosphodiesterase [Motilibacter deserti]|uniref:EAL domain-containing protein n=1 Tax=Motilibacter deserti TaxID=2714956 RepID=A0ABX0GSW8_9ACTN|nr:EAL domain-containing protein [Motilibacter deserti]NHC13206.1 EAL domain-containing protein [Motilibacter deserti]
MRRAGSRGEPLDRRVAAGRAAACFGGVASVSTGMAAATMLHGPARVYTSALAAFVAVLAVVLWRLPWDRWPQRALLAIVPVASVLIGFGNWASPNPYDAVIFFVVLTLWVGATQPRGTSVAVLPVLAVGYWWPLHLVAGDDRERHLLNSSMGYFVLIVIVLGEATAWAMGRMRAVTAELRAHDERRFAALVENASDVTVLLDADGRITYASPSVRSIHGVDPADLLGVAFGDALAETVHPEDRDRAVAALRAAFEHGTATTTLHVRAVDGDGGWREMEWAVADHRADAVLGGVVVTARDVTERRRLERALREQALHDQLTGLANRALLGERMQHARGEGRAVAVLYCDVDGFKPVNDRFGHEHGDRALRETARRLVLAAGPGATVARLGGDEFAVLLPDADEEEGLRVGRRLVEQMALPVELAGAGVARLGVSVGLATGPAPLSARPVLPEEEDLLVAADIAMYAAKSAGGSDVLAYRPSMRESRDGQAALRTALPSAIDGGELRLDYQPVVGLATGELLGVEALIRWDHPTLGSLAPADFLREVSVAGLGARLGRWVVGAACRELAAAREQGPALATAYVSVNVCRAHASSPHFVDDVLGALSDAGLPPDALVVELPACGDLGAPDVLARLRALHAAGVRFALDEIGTGRWSLADLQRLPLAMLKTEPGVGGAGAAPDEPALLPLVTGLARQLGVEVVALGVESAAAAARLRALGVDAGQGYHFGAPGGLRELAAVGVGAQGA